jgi:biotin carboxyl carrier protein
MWKTLLLICSAALSLPVFAAQEPERLLESLDGEIAPGSMVIGKTRPGAEVTLDGRSLRLTPEGYFVFGFGRDADGLVGLNLQYKDQQEDHVYELAERDWPVQRIEGVPQRTVDPPTGETLKRIRREAAQVASARRADSDLQYFLDGFQWPLTGPVTGVYGSQRVYNGEPGRPHYGVDIARPAGTPVRAPAAGTVTLAHPDMFYSGGTLIIDHGYGISSTFIHLQEVRVEEGDRVEQGQEIATVGASGRATGAHLDWRINWYQTRINPQSVVKPMPEETARNDG